MVVVREDQSVIVVELIGDSLNKPALSWVLYNEESHVARVDYKFSGDLVFLQITCTDDSTGVFFTNRWAWDEALGGIKPNWMKEGF